MTAARSTVTIPLVIITGSHGQLVVNGANGLVLDRDNYLDIVRVDLFEYRGWCAKNNLAPAGTVDILLVGYWLRSGKYEKPEADARAEFLREVTA